MAKIHYTYWLILSQLPVQETCSETYESLLCWEVQQLYSICITCLIKCHWRGHMILNKSQVVTQTSPPYLSSELELVIVFYLHFQYLSPFLTICFPSRCQFNHKVTISRLAITFHSTVNCLILLGVQIFGRSCPCRLSYLCCFIFFALLSILHTIPKFFFSSKAYGQL